MYPLLHKLLTVTLKENDGDSSLVKQVKRAVALNLQGQYQDDAVQKLMKFGMFLDPRFKKAPFLSDVLRMVVQTDVHVRNELVKIIREDQSRQDESSMHAHTNDSTQDNDSPSCPKTIKLANLHVLGDTPTILEMKIKWKKI